MLAALKSLFLPDAGDDPATLQHRLDLAAAALLIETARADFVQDAGEEAALAELLCTTLRVERDEVAKLMNEAARRVDEATSLYEFTRLINDHYSADQKRALIGAMWRVAYADGNLDKYEEALIRQVAELTYVPHTDYIRAKLAAGSAPLEG